MIRAEEQVGKQALGLCRPGTETLLSQCSKKAMTSQRGGGLRKHDVPSAVRAHAVTGPAAQQLLLKLTSQQLLCEHGDVMKPPTAQANSKCS